MYAEPAQERQTFVTGADGVARRANSITLNYQPDQDSALTLPLAAAALLVAGVVLLSVDWSTPVDATPRHASAVNVFTTGGFEALGCTFKINSARYGGGVFAAKDLAWRHRVGSGERGHSGRERGPQVPVLPRNVRGLRMLQGHCRRRFVDVRREMKRRAV